MAPSDPRQTKFVLDESRIPRAWYNIAADLPVAPSPPLHPGRTSRSVRTTLRRSSRWRSSARWSAASARSRSRSPSGTRIGSTGRARSTGRIVSRRRSTRLPTSITSTRVAARPAATSPTPRWPRPSTTRTEGVTRLATETGAGQWGSALAFAGAYFGLEVKVYMVRASYDQKPYRRALMETYGSEIVASPSPDTSYGRKVLEETPGHTGSLGLAISEAIEDTVTHPGTKYSLGLGVRLRPAPPDGHRPGIDRPARDGGRGARRHHRLRRRRLELRRARVPVARANVPWRQEVPGHRRRARGGPEPDPRQSTPTTSATRRR